jgi:hypothetical protein
MQNISSLLHLRKAAYSTDAAPVEEICHRNTLWALLGACMSHGYANSAVLLPTSATGEASAGQGD